MKTIAFINNKGGVGKTASVTSVAHMLATRKSIGGGYGPTDEYNNDVQQCGLCKHFQ